MSEVVKVCRYHGDLFLDDVYKSPEKKAKNGFYYKCKKCVKEATFDRPCKIHGDISQEERLSDGRCRICGFERMKKLNEKRNNNREEFNEKMRLKKEANPEWWKQVKKQEYERAVEKEGLNEMCQRKKAARFDLTIEKYREMIDQQKNLCAICNQPETRIFTDRGKFKGEIKIAQLCIDHCHTTGKVRGLLCHKCNIALGALDDNIERMQKMIDFVKKSLID
ncbi:MAG: hypothetical protein EPO02_12810 [Nitrospirae bacterium]|nr:MAG: hypothetical protein EPO02_12810 [Nitrospirota bacterium]